MLEMIITKNKTCNDMITTHTRNNKTKSIGIDKNKLHVAHTYKLSSNNMNRY